jgi:hypothetical protein
MLIFSLPNGDHEVVATVGGTSIAATFTVTGSTYLSGIDYSAASIHVEPVSAAPGAVVTINGSGFPPFGLVQQLVLGAPMFFQCLNPIHTPLGTSSLKF